MAATMPLLGAAEGAAAVGAALRLRHEGREADPEVAAQFDAVLDALGIRDALDELEPPQVAMLPGVVEGFLAQAFDLVEHPERVRWDHVSPSILMAQGHASALLAGTFKQYVVPAFGDDLVQRLHADGASFLDIGSGVAALSVAMCRMWPSLRAVAVDPWEPAIALAREHVAAAGMQDRIDVRPVVAEALEDEAAHDIAWVPSFFISGEVLERGLERVHAALRPGGGLIVGLYARPEIPLAAAVADLRTARQGGAQHTPQDVVGMLGRAGFAEVRVHEDPDLRSPVTFVLGCRRN
jgi:SAM-dependent methyltransferase